MARFLFSFRHAYESMVWSPLLGLMAAAAPCVLGVISALATRPTLSWADRKHVLFLTVTTPQIETPHVTLWPDGKLFVRCSAQLHVACSGSFDVVLLHEVLPGNSSWRVRMHRVEMSITKLQRSRWDNLLASDFAGEVKVDWSKYMDLEDELDDEERRSGVRGPPMVGDSGMQAAVDAYFRRQRVERRDSGGLPDLQEITRRAEAEVSRSGGEFGAVVARLWEEAKHDLEYLRKQDKDDENEHVVEGISKRGRADLAQRAVKQAPRGLKDAPAKRASQQTAASARAETRTDKMEL